MLWQLFEAKSNGFFDDLCAASVASLSYPAINFVNGLFWQACGDCGCSLTHLRGNLAEWLPLFQFFEASANRVFHKLVCARVAVVPRNYLGFFVQILWDRRCLPTCFSFAHVATYSEDTAQVMLIYRLVVVSIVFLSCSVALFVVAIILKQKARARSHPIAPF